MTSTTVAMISLAGVVAAFDFDHPKVPAGPSLRLAVGPGVTAEGHTAMGGFACSDNARCIFQVPLDTPFEIAASARPGHQFHWTGCQSHAAADRCTVRMTGQSAQISVR